MRQACQDRLTDYEVGKPGMFKFEKYSERGKLSENIEGVVFTMRQKQFSQLQVGEF